MATDKLRYGLMVVGTAVADVVFIWFGARVLFSNVSLSSGQLSLIGLGAFVAAIMILSSSYKQRILTGGGVLLLSIYYFLRAADVLTVAWLNMAVGIASWVAAVLLTYVVWSSRPSRPVSE